MNEGSVVNTTFKIMLILTGLSAIIFVYSRERGYSTALNIHNIDIMFLSLALAGICLASYFIAMKVKYSLHVYLLASIAIYAVIFTTIIVW